MKSKDGGSAFPTITQAGSVALSEGGLTRRDWFATFAPKPSRADINLQGEFDRQANPHNENHKPRRRSHKEIIADLRYAYADAMIAASEKS